MPYDGRMQIQTPLESGIFSSVGDLPMHPLIVHFAVVLLPVSALILLVAAFVPAVRRRFLGLSLIGALLGVVATFVSKESGEALAAVVGEPESHAAWGDRLMVVSAIFLGVAGTWWILARRRDGDSRSGSTSGQRSAGGLVTVLGLVTAALSVAVVILSILTGHSGAQAAWGATFGQSSAVTTDDDDSATAADSQASPRTTTDGDTYTLADVETHDSASDCWAAVDDGVYDLTDWISQHPGGQSAITNLCGTDATDQFAQQHGSNEEAQQALSEQRIGALSS